jgi:hypothetical protein
VTPEARHLLQAFVTGEQMIPIGLAPAAGAPPAAVATAVPEAAEAAPPAAPFAQLLAAMREAAESALVVAAGAEGSGSTPTAPVRAATAAPADHTFLALPAAQAAPPCPGGVAATVPQTALLPAAAAGQPAEAAADTRPPQAQPTGPAGATQPRAAAASLPLASAPPAGAASIGALPAAEDTAATADPPRASGPKEEEPACDPSVQLRPAETAASPSPPPSAPPPQAVGAPALAPLVVAAATGAGATIDGEGDAPFSSLAIPPGRGANAGLSGLAASAAATGRPARGLSPTAPEGAHVSAAVAPSPPPPAPAGEAAARRAEDTQAEQPAAAATRPAAAEDSLLGIAQPPEQRANRPSVAAEVGGPSPPVLAASAASPAMAAPVLPPAARGGMAETPPLAGSPATAPAEMADLHLSYAARAEGARIELRLEPPGMGAVEVALEAAGSRAEWHIRAERPDVLRALAEDGAALQRALREAGFAPAGGSFGFLARQDHPAGERNASPPRSAATLRPEAPPQRLATSLLDIRI